MNPIALMDLVRNRRLEMARQLNKMGDQEMDTYISRVFRENSSSELLAMIGIVLNSMRRSLVEDLVHGDDPAMTRERIRTTDLIFNQIFLAPFANTMADAVKSYSPEEDENRFFLERSLRESQGTKSLR